MGVGALDDAGGGQGREADTGSREWQQSRAPTKRHAPAAADDGGIGDMTDDIPF